MFELSIQEIQSVSGAGQCKLEIKLESHSEGHLSFTSRTTGDCDQLRSQLESGDFQKRYAALIELGMEFNYTLTEI